MNFDTLPPEINSGRMYSGPGSASLISAATAWDDLAAKLYDVAADYGSVTAKLAEGWQGAAATAMTRAAAPYLRWLNATAAQAQQAVIQARAAANAYESALAAMVPPPVIDANRALWTSLASTNCLGQAGPAIADIEADYEEMWAQDADAMYDYGRASANASTLTPFTSPPPTAAVRQGPTGIRGSGTWALTAAPDVISAGYQVMSAIPEALQELSASPLTTFGATLSSVTTSLSKLSSLSAPLDFAIGHLNSLNKMAALRSLLPHPGGTSGTRFTAGFGRGTSIGTLSVPQAWATAAPSPVAAELQRGWVCELVRIADVNEPPM